jgi:AbrB family looped-hinge helix DNA binding protein
MIQVMAKRIVDGQGRVVLPKSVRKKLDIQPEDRMLVMLRHGEIVIEKLTEQIEEKRMCYISGVKSTECQPFSGGIHLSEEAALLLLEEMKSK